MVRPVAADRSALVRRLPGRYSTDSAGSPTSEIEVNLLLDALTDARFASPFKERDVSVEFWTLSADSPSKSVRLRVFKLVLWALIVVRFGRPLRAIVVSGLSYTFKVSNCFRSVKVKEASLLL